MCIRVKYIYKYLHLSYIHTHVRIYVNNLYLTFFIKYVTSNYTVTFISIIQDIPKFAILNIISKKVFKKLNEKVS